jgi:hypothetical protein
MPFRHARARLPDCISIIGQIRRDLHARHHNEMWEGGEMFTGHGTIVNSGEERSADPVPGVRLRMRIDTNA